MWELGPGVQGSPVPQCPLLQVAVALMLFVFSVWGGSAAGAAAWGGWWSRGWSEVIFKVLSNPHQAGISSQDWYFSLCTAQVSSELCEQEQSVTSALVSGKARGETPHW